MKCRRAERDCFALGVERECMCLSDTMFIRRACPFYKRTKYDYISSYVFKGIPGTWKKVRGYDGKYFVSDDGMVMNYKKHKLVVNYYSGKPYVNLISADGCPTRTYLAEIVADAFCPGIGIIDFHDGNVTNCTAQNIYRRTLRWRENQE